MRRSSRPSTVCRVSTSRVFARPGTPISRTWPPLSNAINVCSMTGCWPKITRPMLWRAWRRRSPSASISLASASALTGLVSVVLTRFSGVGRKEHRRMKGGASNPMGMLIGLAGGKSQPRQGGQRPAGGGRPVLLGDLQIRIARDGTWFYQGSPIARPPLVKLFASVLRREEDGEYWLVTPAERGRVGVDDVPFVAVAVRAEGAGRDQRLVFRSNLDEEAVADAAHPLSVVAEPGSGATIPYIPIRDRLEARILRPVFYHLVEFGEQNGEQFGVWSSGRFFPLGRLDSVR